MTMIQVFRALPSLACLLNCQLLTLTFKLEDRPAMSRYNATALNLNHLVSAWLVYVQIAALLTFASYVPRATISIDLSS